MPAAGPPAVPEAPDSACAGSRGAGVDWQRNRVAVTQRGRDDRRMQYESPRLTPPSSRVRRSFLTAVAEFRAEDGNDRTLEDRDFAAYGDGWTTPSGFEAFVASLRAEAWEQTTRPAWKVPQTNLWWTRGLDYLGRIGIRHRLTPELLEVGGHIGYAVRPTARRQGHATAMLRAGLTVACRLGIASALITCDADNVGSQRVIEGNGGVLENRRGIKLRFWVPTVSK